MTDTNITPIRASRVAAVDAKLIAAHGHDPEALAAAIRQHPVRDTTSNRACIKQVLQRVHEVNVLVRSVLDKFPMNTIPDSLRWARVDRRSSVRLEGDDVVIRYVIGWSQKLGNGTFPARLLDAQDSEITEWARAAYWEHQRAERRAAEAAKRKERATLTQRVAEIKRDLAAAESKLALAMAEA